MKSNNSVSITATEMDHPRRIEIEVGGYSNATKDIESTQISVALD